MPELPDAAPRGVGDEPADEWDEENDDLLYLKYMFEGAASITELTAALRHLADELDQQGAAGWRLAEPVCNGYAHLKREVGS
jgi:hypothetical protein